MKPERYKKINGKMIEEYYWADKLVVYVNNRKFDGTFEEACKLAEMEEQA